MNIIDAISRNHFLKDIYPTGLTEGVMIGHVGFDLDDRFSLNIHTKQRPAKEIPKWGQWGEDYNVVVICLLGVQIRNIEISHWDRTSFSPMHCTAAGKNYTISIGELEWKISLTFSSLVFQECHTYTW